MKLLLIILFTYSLCFSDTLYIASASSLRPLLDRIIPLFKKEYPHVKVKVSYASSGSLYRQILGGAPYNVFLSASELYVNKLTRKGQARDSFTFALGKLAVFSTSAEVKRLEDLDKVDKIAIASPRHAPYGKAALEVLKGSGLYDKVATKLIYGSNVGQALQFVVSGGAEVGIVSLSLVMPLKEGYYFVVEERLYSPIKHVAAIVGESDYERSAKLFISFLKGKEVREHLRLLGFGVR